MGRDAWRFIFCNAIVNGSCVGVVAEMIQDSFNWIYLIFCNIIILFIISIRICLLQIVIAASGIHTTKIAHFQLTTFISIVLLYINDLCAILEDGCQYNVSNSKGLSWLYSSSELDKFSYILV